MLVVKDSLFVFLVCLFSCYYNKSNLTKLKNPILFRLNSFADGFLILYSVYIIHQLLLITGVTIILIRKTRH